MGKKNKIIDLKSLNISYKEKNQICTVNFLKTDDMTVEISIYENEKIIEKKTIAFAHLPKSAKKLVNPFK